MASLRDIASRISQYFNPTSNNGNNFWGAKPVQNTVNTINRGVQQYKTDLRQVYNPQRYTNMIGNIPIIPQQGFGSTNAQGQFNKDLPLKEFLNPRSWAGGPAGQAVGNTIEQNLGALPMASLGGEAVQAGKIALSLPRAVKSAVLSAGIPVVSNFLKGEKQSPEQIATFAMMGSIGGFGAKEPLGNKESVGRAYELLSHNLRQLKGDVTIKPTLAEVEKSIELLSKTKLTGNKLMDDTIKIANYIKSVKEGALVNRPTVGMGITEVKRQVKPVAQGGIYDIKNNANGFDVIAKNGDRIGQYVDNSKNFVLYDANGQKHILAGVDKGQLQNNLDAILQKHGVLPLSQPQTGGMGAKTEVISKPELPKIKISEQPNLQRGQTEVVQQAIQPQAKTQILQNQLGQDTSNPIISPNVRERGFVTSVKEAPQITNPVKEGTKGMYTIKPNTQLMGEAEALLQEGASIKFDQVQGLDKKVTATIKYALAEQKAGNSQAAANLYNNLSENLTEMGRGVQAASLLSKMSPEAIALSAAGRIKKYNLTARRPIPELTGDQVKIIGDQVAKIDGLAGREKNIAINQLRETIDNFIPSSLADKALTVWKAGLLTSLRTHERNLLGNTIMGGAEVAKDLPATLADKLMSLGTGKRTVTLTGQGSVGGFKKGLQSAKDIIQTGFDPEDAIGKYDVKRITWGNNPVEQVLKKATEIVFRPLAAADKPFWNSSFGRSLYDQAGAEAINVGKQGNKTFIENLVNNPTEEMLKVAFNDANTATFHDKGAISSVASALKRELSKNELGKIVGEVTMPFTGVPSSIVGKTVAYSPLGLIKGAIDTGRVLAGQVPELQRQAAQEVGRGVIGTGLFGLGAYLMSKGLMTGQPKDAKESALWQAEGKQGNSVLIGGKWRLINSIGPQNLIILAGAKYQEEMGKPEGSLGTYGMNLGKDQLSQTFLAGVQQPLNALTDPARYGKSYVGNQAASLIPNIVKDASKSIDPNARETNTMGDYIKQGIPGLRNTLLPKRDVLGNIVPQEPTGVGAFVDLFNSKTPISNPVVDELTRLSNTGNEATPSKLTASQTILKNKVKLTFDQLNNLEAGVGEQLRPQLEALVTSPAYQQLDDENKAKAIDRVVQDVRTKYKNLNAESITSGTTPTTGLSTQSNIIPIVSEDGSLKMVDLSEQPELPQLTGYTELDKKLISKFNGEITSKANDIVALYQAGKLTEEEASQQLEDLKTLKARGAGAKKPKKVSLKISKPKTVKIKVGSVKPIKLKKAPTYKITKPKNIKLSIGNYKVPKLKLAKIKGLDNSMRLA